MKPQRLLKKFTLLTCISVSVVMGAQQGLVIAADWNLFDAHESTAVESARVGETSADTNVIGMELHCPYITAADAKFSAPAIETAAESSLPSPDDAATPETLGGMLPEDRFEYDYEFDHAYPSARYAADAYMEEQSDNYEYDAEADADTDSATEDEAYYEEAATENDGTDNASDDAGTLPMLILEDEASLEDALNQLDASEEASSDPFVLEDEASLEAALAILDASEEEVPADPFFLADEASLEHALAILDAEREDAATEKAAWVAVGVEEEESLEGTPEEAVHDWLYYDYTYEPDYSEVDAADDLYPDVYALESAAATDEKNNAADQAVAEEKDATDTSDVNPEIAGETEFDHPVYYEYDYGMFEYIDSTTDEATDNGTADEDAVDETGSAHTMDDAAYYGNDPMDGYYATDTEWSEDADQAADNATDGGMFVEETDANSDDVADDDSNMTEDSLHRDSGTWDQGNWDQGNWDQGDWDQGNWDQGKLDKPEDQDSDQEIPGDREPTADNVPADLRRSDEDLNQDEE